MEKQLLTAAHAAWCAMEELRTRRARFKRYTYGDQWDDLVPDGKGGYVREGDIASPGTRQPLTNNLIRRLVKTIVGRHRSLARSAGRYRGAMAGVDALNDLAELDSRLLEEFLISGCAVQRVVRDTRPSGEGVWVDNVSAEDFFVGPFRDPRGHDVEMLGMVHNMSVHQLMARFGADDTAQMHRLAVMAAGRGDMPGLSGADSGFFGSPTAGTCRVVELWTLDAVKRSAQGGRRIAFVWRCRWMLTDGTLLASHTAPRHPFVFKFYPYTDGEVHPFVEDVIDQQRYINRLIVLIDRMMGATAKGVLLFPVDQKVPGFSWEEVRQRWSSADGVIPVTGRSAVMPQQVNTPAVDTGAHRLLELELKLFEDVSGVSDALAGKSTGGNEGTAHYESRVANSTIALADTLDTFAGLLGQRDALALTLAQ